MCLILNTSDSNYKEGRNRNDLNRLVVTTHKAISALYSVLFCDNIIQKTEKGIYRTIIEGVLLHNAETLTINKSHEKKLPATEFVYWRRSSRASRLERKTNIEVRNQLSMKTKNYAEDR